MADTVITTVCSADSYQNYIPLFVYSALRACPESDVIILLTGKMNDIVRAGLSKVPPEWGGRWRVLEDQFLDIPATAYTTNCLRYLIPHGLLHPYKYAYITDVDFVMLPHKIGLFRYFTDIMRVTKMPIASWRSAIRRAWRPEIHGTGGWEGKYRRIVGGTTMIDVRKWYKATSSVRDAYMRAALKRRSDGVDKHVFGSYREYDEVMLCRMCVMSGIATPDIKDTFVNGIPYNRMYRDIHLGDLKWGKKVGRKRFRKMVTRVNKRKYLKLWKKHEWRDILEVCYAYEPLKNLILLSYSLCRRKS
jgi:hypothetical protein